MSNRDKGPGVKIPPPLIFFLFAILAFTAERSYQVPYSLPEAVIYSGLCLGVLGICIALVSAFQFWKTKTHIEPWKPASTLIDTGIFAYSRNPIYLAFILITCGVGLYLESIGVVLSNIPAIYGLYYLVISKEEKYLEAVFGDQYRNYKKRVRRWL